VAVASALLVAAEAAGGVGAWSSGGPEGGPILDLERDPSDPDIVYAVPISSGVFKSVDGGATWASSSNGLSEWGGEVIVVDPSATDHLYLGKRGVFRSTDGGDSWEATSLPSTVGVEALAVDPDASGTVFAGTSDGVRVTTDGGDSWSDASAGLPASAWVTDLAIDPSNTDVLYAALGSGAIYKSINHGSTWSSASVGLPATDQVFSLAVDPTAPTTVYAGLLNSAVYVTTNGGASWSAASTGLPSGSVWARHIEIDPTAPSTVYVALDIAGVYRTSNGGALWSAADTGLPTLGQASCLTIDPSAPAELLVGLDVWNDGVYITTNSGGSWSPSNTQLTAANIAAVAVDPMSPSVALAAAWASGVYRTDDGGQSWASSSSGLPLDSVADVVFLGSSSSNALAATQGDGVYATTNGGSSWSPSSTGLPSPAVLYFLVVDPGNASLVLATLSAGLYRSLDGGASWSAVGTGLPSSGAYPRNIAADSTGSTWYAVLSGGVYTSVDDGATWSLVGSGSPTGGNAVAVDPTDPLTVLVGTGGTGNGPGLYRSTDGGETWALVAETGSDVSDVAIDPNMGSRVYLAWGTDDGIDVSADGGVTWAGLDAGLPVAGVWWPDLAVAPSEPAVVYAGTSTAGVLQYRFPVATVAATVPVASEVGPVDGELVVLLDQLPEASVDVYLTPSGAATEGADYVALPSPVTVAAGADQKVLAVSPLDDPIDEGSEETVEVTVAAGAEYLVGSSSPASLVIEDDDTAGIEVDPPAVEVVEGGGEAMFEVVLLSEPPADVAIGLTASDPSEAAVSPASLTFTAGDWSTPQTVTVSPVDDSVLDGAVMSWIVTQPASSSDPYYDGLDAIDVELVTHDDDPHLVAADVGVCEVAGFAEVWVEVVPSSPVGVEFDYATSDDTAIEPADYTATAGHARLDPGTDGMLIEVPVMDDGAEEGPEHLLVVLFNPINATIPVDQIVVTIVDQDGAGAMPGDATGDCQLDAADLAELIRPISQPGSAVPGNPDCTGSGAPIDGSDSACVVNAVFGP
jgi:hypothetical protein